MNKLIKAFCLTLALSFAILAQTNDDYNKNEFYVGYSNQQSSNDIYRSFNGVEAAYVRNVNRYFGIKGDFSAAYKNGRFNGKIIAGEPVTVGNTTFTTLTTYTADFNASVYNFLGGVQIKDNSSKTRFKPFAHALVGAAYNRVRTKNLTCLTNCSTTTISDTIPTFSDTGFAAAFGGGLDIKINDKIDLRAIQVDYNPVRSNITGRGFRFGIGIVFK